MLERVASFLEPMLLQTPLNPWSLAPGNLMQLAKPSGTSASSAPTPKQAIEILTAQPIPFSTAGSSPR